MRDRKIYSRSEEITGCVKLFFFSLVESRAFKTQCSLRAVARTTEKSELRGMNDGPFLVKKVLALFRAKDN